MASNTKFVQEQVQPAVRQLREAIKAIRSVEEAYNSLGGASFIEGENGNLPVEGYEELTGAEVVSGMATIQAFLNLWGQGHRDNAAKVALKE